MPSPSPEPTLRFASVTRARAVAARALPERRGWLAAGVATWLGCLAGWGTRSFIAGAVLILVGAVLAARTGRAAALVALAAAGSISGTAAVARLDAMLAVPVTSGRADVEVVAATDPVAAPEGMMLLATVEAPPGGPAPTGTLLRVTLDGAAAASAGDRLLISGHLADRPGRYGPDRYRATLSDARILDRDPAHGLVFATGNALRQLVLHRLDPHRDRPEGALLAGFLVGDTSGMSGDDLDDLRAAGLTHYVAVSGSNVALFLAAWFLLVGPVGLGLRLRAVSGLAALGVFVVATRWEPSVVRAATMAGVVLGGTAAGIPVDVWRALGVTVTGLLLVSGDLAVDVGFQLSVLATLGVLAGMRLAPPRRPKWLWSVIAASVAAQVAVMPILLLWFGTIPLLSPVANVVAAPLVTAATALGGVGVLTGVGAVAEPGLAAARGVLAVAHLAGGWPQLDASGVAVLGVSVAAWRSPRLRPVIAGVACFALVATMLPPPPPRHAGLVFLDVGQGDAIAVTDPSGAVALVDGGRRPDVLEAALRRQGIGDIDLLVITHGDADHVGGLVGLVERRRVHEVWYARGQRHGEIMTDVVSAAAAAGVVVREVGRGDATTLGTVRLDVLGPARRYDADNDGSVVLWVAAGGGTALLTGDVEAVAQADLPALRPDVLHVPHHGSATTDPGWIAATVGATAVISVGPNPYGHPAPEILDVLDAGGATVLTTALHGDVTVDLCTGCRAAAPARVGAVAWHSPDPSARAVHARDPRHRSRRPPPRRLRRPARPPPPQPGGDGAASRLLRRRGRHRRAPPARLTPGGAVGGGDTGAGRCGGRRCPSRRRGAGGARGCPCRGGRLRCAPRRAGGGGPAPTSFP